jgi:hypothetical protein
MTGKITHKEYEDLIATALLGLGELNGSSQKEIWKAVHGTNINTIEKDFLLVLSKMIIDKGGKLKPPVEKVKQGKYKLAVEYKEKLLAALEKGKSTVNYDRKSKTATKNAKSARKKAATKRRAKKAASKKTTKRGGRKTKGKAQTKKGKPKAKTGVVAKTGKQIQPSTEAKGEKVKAEKKEKQAKIV